MNVWQANPEPNCFARGYEEAGWLPLPLPCGFVIVIILHLLSTEIQCK